MTQTTLNQNNHRNKVDEVQRTADVLEVIATDVREWLKKNGHSNMGRYLITSCWEHVNALDKALKEEKKETEENVSRETKTTVRLLHA